MWGCRWSDSIVVPHSCPLSQTVVGEGKRWQRRRLEVAWRCLCDLAWLDSCCMTLTKDIEDNEKECHQWRSESGVGSWLEGKTDGQRSAPSLSPSWWQWRVGLSISLSQASAAVTGALYPPLHPTSLSVAALRRLETRRQAIDARPQSKRDAGWSVGGTLRWLIKRFTDDAASWRHACASRYLRSRRLGSSCTGPSIRRAKPSASMICRARLPPSVRSVHRAALSRSNRTEAGWGISPMYGRTRRSIRSAGSLLARRVFVCIRRARLSTSALYNQWRRAMTG